MNTKQMLLTTLTVALMVLESFSQTDQENQDKYWAYRDRLRKNFLKVGNFDGESMPMAARRIDWAFAGQNAEGSPFQEASACYSNDLHLKFNAIE